MLRNALSLATSTWMRVGGRSIPLLWHRTDSSGRRFVREYGLFLRPKEVKSPRIQSRYDELVASFNRLAGD